MGRVFVRLEVLDRGVGQYLHGLTHGGDVVRLVEQHLHARAAGEVDIEQILAAHVAGRQADADHDRAKSHGKLAVADEVDRGLAHQLHHVELLDPTVFLDRVEDDARDGDGREQVGEQADDQGDGEAFDLIGAAPVEHHTGDERGDVGVDDRGGGPIEAIANGHAERGALGEFFAHAFINEHVGVDGHADRERQAGQTGERERGVEHHHQCDGEQHVEHHGNVGHDAGEAIVNEHEDHDRDGPDEHRVDTFFDRVATERGADEHFAGRLFFERRGQAARL